MLQLQLFESRVTFLDFILKLDLSLQAQIETTETKTNWN